MERQEPEKVLTVNQLHALVEERKAIEKDLYILKNAGTQRLFVGEQALSDSTLKPALIKILEDQLEKITKELDRIEIRYK